MLVLCDIHEMTCYVVTRLDLVPQRQRHPPGKGQISEIEKCQFSDFQEGRLAMSDDKLIRLDALRAILCTLEIESGDGRVCARDIELQIIQKSVRTTWSRSQRCAASVLLGLAVALSCPLALCLSSGYAERPQSAAVPHLPKIFAAHDIFDSLREPAVVPWRSDDQRRRVQGETCAPPCILPAACACICDTPAPEPSPEPSPSPSPDLDAVEELLNAEPEAQELPAVAAANESSNYLLLFIVLGSIPGILAAASIYCYCSTGGKITPFM